MYEAGYSPGDIPSHDRLLRLSICSRLRIATGHVEPKPLRRSRDNLFVLGSTGGGLGTASGIIGEQRILRMLKDSLHGSRVSQDFDKFAMPFRCIGTDGHRRKARVFPRDHCQCQPRFDFHPGVFTPIR